MQIDKSWIFCTTTSTYVMLYMGTVHNKPEFVFSPQKLTENKPSLFKVRDNLK